MSSTIHLTREKLLFLRHSATLMSQFPSAGSSLLTRKVTSSLLPERTGARTPYSRSIFHRFWRGLAMQTTSFYGNLKCSRTILASTATPSHINDVTTTLHAADLPMCSRISRTANARLWIMSATSTSSAWFSGSALGLLLTQQFSAAREELLTTRLKDTARLLAIPALTD